MDLKKLSQTYCLMQHHTHSTFLPSLPTTLLSGLEPGNAFMHMQSINYETSKRMRLPPLIRRPPRVRKLSGPGIQSRSLVYIGSPSEFVNKKYMEKMF